MQSVEVEEALQIAMGQSTKVSREKKPGLAELEDRSLGDVEIQSYIRALEERYKEYDISLEEGRKVIDRAMGRTTLTDVLRQMRNETA